MVLKQGNYDETEKLLTEYVRHSGILRHNNEVLPGYELLYYIKGMYCLGTNNVDSCKFYLDKILSSTSEINSVKAAYEGLYKYYALSYSQI